jgi:Protein of unknown function (DUF4199)
MNPISKYTIGVRFGLIAGLLYVIFLFCRFKFFSYSTDVYFLSSLISYFLILLIFLMAGIFRKRELGGFAQIREIFQTIFIAILIAEAFYVVFVGVYMKWMNPDFAENFKTSSLAFFRSNPKLSIQDINQRMTGVDSLVDQMKPSGLIKGYGTAVVVDSIFGFLFAFIVRNQKPKTAESKL